MSEPIMNIPGSLSADSKLQAPPSRTILRRLGKAFYPIIFAVISLTGAVFFYGSGERLLVWVWLGFSVVFFALLLMLSPYIRGPWSPRQPRGLLIDLLYGPALGIAGLFGSIVALLVCAFLVERPQPLSIFLWPALVFPIQVFLGRYHGERRSLTIALVLLATLSVAAILVVDWLSTAPLSAFEPRQGFPLPAVISSLLVWLFIYDSFFRIFRASLYKGRDASVRAVMRDMVGRAAGDAQEDEKFLHVAVEKIHWLHHSHIVSIVLCERGDPMLNPQDVPGATPETYAYAHTLLRVAASAGVSDELRDKMKPWSACQGLTGLMVRRPGESYLIDKDVSEKSQDYYSPEWWTYPARSEMVVPIRAGGLLFGLIDVQSRTPGDFSVEDADALTAIALPLATEFQARTIDNLYRSDRELWESLSELEDEEQMIHCFGEYISRLAGVDVGIYFPLGIGTAYPSQQPYHFGYLREPGKIAEVGRVSPVVTERVARGEIEFVSEAQENASLQKFNVKREPFVLRENIYSMCFVPISMGDMKLAGLFLNYHAHESFGALRRLSISILTQTLTHHISRIRYKDPIYKRLSQPRFHLHRIFNMSGLTKARLDADFQSLAQNAPEIKDQLASLKERILEGIKQAYFEGSLMDMDFEHEELKTRLESFAWSMRHENSISKPELRIVPFIDEKIEQESSDIKVILMALTMEGIFNAIKHSQADFIEIHIERRPYGIHFSILNDIKTARLPDPETFMSKPHGIIEIMRDVRKALFAPEEKWIVNSEKRTIKLVFDIPAFSPEMENGV